MPTCSCFLTPVWPSARNSQRSPRPPRALAGCHRWLWQVGASSRREKHPNICSEPCRALLQGKVAGQSQRAAPTRSCFFSRARRQRPVPAPDGAERRYDGTCSTVPAAAVRTTLRHSSATMVPPHALLLLLLLLSNIYDSSRNRRAAPQGAPPCPAMVAAGRKKRRLCSGDHPS
jgi:hypothetical protein